MKAQNWIVAIIVLIVLGAGAWFVLAKHSSGSNPMPSMSMSPSASSASSANPASASSVTIKNFAFSPSAITVKKGTTVTWTNSDSIGHTVTETDSQTGPKSSTIAQGKTYSFTYNTAGTFHYECSIHPYMTGSVTVTD